MAKTDDWKAIVSVQAIARPDTERMFKEVATVTGLSPVDEFLRNTDAINKLYVGHLSDQSDPPPELGSLVLLGYMSAVESYFRAILRRAIRVDRQAQTAVELMQVTYGAAVHHTPELLPEALFEGVSFAGKKGAVEFVKSALGIAGNLPVEVEAGLPHFLAICELRHCCVHRFGKLGSQNAIKLGIVEHKGLIEQPFEPSLDHLQEIADTLRTFTKTVNNWLWGALLHRTVKGSKKTESGSINWTWTWISDEAEFQKYYGLFAALTDTPASPTAKESYEAFAKAMGPKGAPFDPVDDPDEE